MAKKPNPILGKGKCLMPDCGATVEIKLAFKKDGSEGDAFYTCNAALEGKACGDRHFFGRRHTERFKELAANPAPDPEPEPEPVEEPEIEAIEEDENDGVHADGFLYLNT